MRQYADPPRLRIVRPRSIHRAPDLIVEPSRFDAQDEGPVTPAESPAARRRTMSGTRQVAIPIITDYDEESVASADLILEPFESSDEPVEETPITMNSPWMRQIPPPLPRRSS